MNRNSILNSRRFKYGSVATVFTVAFVAIVVIFNIIFSALAQRYMWYIDMTEKQVYTLSEEAREIMSDITEDVWLHFASEPDELMNGTNSSYTRYIYTTALQLEEAFPNVHVDAVSVLKNPSYFREYYSTTATDIDTTSVVITTGNETRVVRAQAFFVAEWFMVRMKCLVRLLWPVAGHPINNPILFFDFNACFPAVKQFCENIDKVLSDME